MLRELAYLAKQSARRFLNFVDRDCRSGKGLPMGRWSEERQGSELVLGDAVPLSSGGYGFGRTKGIYLKAFVWVEFLDVQSQQIIGIDELARATSLGDFKGGYWSLVKGDWPLIGKAPLGDVANVPLRPLAKVRQSWNRGDVYAKGTLPGRTKKEQLDALQWLFPVGYNDDHVREILEWRLAGNEGLPWPED